MNPKTLQAVSDAQEILYNLSDETDDAGLINAAKKALAITPYCMGGWLILAEFAESEKEAITILKNGIDHGRELHAELIASVGNEYGMWGHVEARDFMRLLHELATLYDETGEVEKAVEVYEEMLRLNPDDNQGIRGDLLHSYIILDQTDQAHELLERFESIIGTDTDLAYGAAFLEIISALDESHDDWMEKIEREQPTDIAGFRKFFGKNFNAVDRAMKAAIQTNPYVSMIMSMPGMMEIESLPYFSIGGPNEALIYAQKHGPTWFSIYLPFVMASTYALNLNENRPDTEFDHLEELEAISEIATDPNHTPWWEDPV